MPCGVVFISVLSSVLVDLSYSVIHSHSLNVSLVIVKIPPLLRINF